MNNEELNLLIRIVIAHILSDFVFQTNHMVQTKSWKSKSMMIHIGIVFITTLLFSFQFLLSLVIALGHWIIDCMKVDLQKRNPDSQSSLFIADQVIHILLIVVTCFIHFDKINLLPNLISSPFLSIKSSIYISAYLFVIFPVSFLIKLVTANFTKSEPNGVEHKFESVEDGGKTIGYFERIIILTLVLLSQYEAIGFLITGKGIMRFADTKSNLRSEYVLVGTMMSYAFAILTGVAVRLLFREI